MISLDTICPPGLTRQDLDSFFPTVSGTRPHLSSEDQLDQWDCISTWVRKGLFSYQKASYWTPLHIAATRNDVELLSLLLDKGGNLKSAGRGVCPCQYRPVRRTCSSFWPVTETTGETAERRFVTRWWSPLHVAVCKANLDCAHQLVSGMRTADNTEADAAVLAGAQEFLDQQPEFVSAPDIVERLTTRLDPLTPLHVAVETFTRVEDLEKVYAMLDRDALLEDAQSGIDILDDVGDTPFAVAAFSGRIRIFGRWLCDHNVNINFALRGPGSHHRTVFNALCEYY